MVELRTDLVVPRPYRPCNSKQERRSIIAASIKSLSLSLHMNTEPRRATLEAAKQGTHFLYRRFQ
jgi:hypothetical protein